MRCNVFDNPSFFKKYMELREDYNHNDLLERPEMTNLLPPLAGRSVIDLGCGCGVCADDFIVRGAVRYLGIDSSEKMLSVARAKHNRTEIEFLNMDLEELSVDGTFDLAYSSLAFHYIKDFDRLLKAINSILNPSGTLLFSQMHPLISASDAYSGYFDGEYFAFSSYQDEGKREGYWFKEKIISYHRKTSSIINSLVSHGFAIERIVEPMPTSDAVRTYDALERDLVRPTFLIVKARKVREL